MSGETRSNPPSPADESSGPGVEAAAPDARERQYPCKGCGAGLLFRPGSDSITCPYCGFVEPIPRTAQSIAEYGFNEHLAKPKRGLATTGRDVRCAGCGAIVHLEAETKSTRCTFCGTAHVDPVGDVGEADVRPEAVAAFRIEAREAEKRFHEWVAKLWFAPSSLREDAREARVKGIYCPYWTYDAHTTSHYTGERGDAYYTTETYTAMVNGKPQTRTRQRRHVRWTFVSGTHEAFFDDVLVSGSDHRDLDLEFDARRLVPYAPHYLAGFEAERPSVTVETGWARARERIVEAVRAACRRRIGGDEQRLHSVDTAYRGITFKMVLLPVWLSSFRWREKTYRFQVDGQTGRVRGERPWSFWKIFFFVLGLLALIGLVATVVALAQR